MIILRRIILWISSLKVAIVLLFTIAFASAIGTTIPQGEPINNYLEVYNNQPWLGILNGSLMIKMQLNHIYTSLWFLLLLLWLGLALIICSWRRQIPTLLAALKWSDYNDPRQLYKLAIAKTVSVKSPEESLGDLSGHLTEKGWQVKNNKGRLAARSGLIGRIGPPIVHIGIIVLMIGAIIGALSGQRFERFLAPERSFQLLNRDGKSQLIVKLKSFNIDRDPKGIPEQFRSRIELIDEGQKKGFIEEISVNHPFRYRGMTIYQADWGLAAITLKLNNSPPLQLPLEILPEFGSQSWGVIIPTKIDGSESILISLSNEKGPALIFNSNGSLLKKISPGGQSVDINGTELSIINIIPSSGILLKRDPGVPIVYTGFAITMIGTAISLISTKQLWAISDPEGKVLHIGGLSNRNIIGFANELPFLLNELNKSQFNTTL